MKVRNRVVADFGSFRNLQSDRNLSDPIGCRICIIFKNIGVGRVSDFDVFSIILDRISFPVFKFLVILGSDRFPDVLDLKIFRMDRVNFNQLPISPDIVLNYSISQIGLHGFFF